MGKVVKPGDSWFISGILGFLFLAGCGTSPGEFEACVTGNSMLPTLHGPAVYETCEVCGFCGLRCETGTSVCPNCSWLTQEKERKKQSCEFRSGEKIHIVPQTVYKPDDVVVVIPNEKIGPVIKRVVGIPGDRLEVHYGALYRNGKRVVHSFETWRKMRILVFNDDFRPNGRSRWEVSENETESSSSDTRNQTNIVPEKILEISSGTSEPSSPMGGSIPLPDGWELNGSIQYKHQTARFTSAGCKFESAPITNQRAENGTQFPLDQIQLVSEFMLEFELDLRSPQSGFPLGTELLVTLPTHRFRLTRKLLEKLPMRKNVISVSTLDGIPRIWVDGILLKDASCESGNFGMIQIQSLPESVQRNHCTKCDGTFSGTLTENPYKIKIHHISLFRGEIWPNFLTNFHYFAKKSEKMLAFDCGSEYYVVGDNLFVSKDSRFWGAVSSRQILGKKVDSLCNK